MKTRGFYEQEYATKREVVDIATQIASSLIDDSDEIKGTVLLFADLPSANLWTDKLWIVQQSSGSWLTLNYKQSGIYKSNGTIWSLLDSTDDIVSSFNTKADKVTTISAGSGLTGGGDLSSNKTISHADTSSQANVNNTSGYVIKSMTFDAFGHVQSVESVNLDTRYTIANLGATTIGANLFTLPNPNAITFLRINADNTASTLNVTDFQLAIGASATATASSLVLRDAGGSFLATNGGFSGQLLITRGWDGAINRGQLFLAGLTGNRIDWSAAGSGAPAFTTRSVGTKLVFRQTLSSSQVDYGVGLTASSLWQSVPTTAESFGWYFGETLLATLTNTSLTAPSFIKSGGLSSQFLKADGSVDSTSYLPLSGGTMSGAITFAVGQTWPTWSIAQGGTGATTAAGARTNLELGSSATLNAGVANGVATLDGSGTIPLTQIPASLQGALQYAGTWDASINSPTLTSGAGTKGYYYVVNVAGSTALNGINEWKIGDWAIYNGTAWQKIDNTDAVVSVNGLTGAVVLSTSNVAEGTNLYYTDTRTRLAISSTATGLTYNNGTGAFTLTAGYSIPTTASQTNWDTAFNDRNKWDGGATGLVASTGRTSLGGTTIGQNLFTLPNPSAISFLRINADNTASTLNATDFRTAIGAGTGNGTLTRVDGVSPVVTTGGITPSVSLADYYGEIKSPFSLMDPNLFYAGPQSGIPRLPAFRSIVAADIPALAYIGGSGTTNTLPKFSASTTLANSSITDNGTLVTIGSSGHKAVIGGTATPSSKIAFITENTNGLGLSAWNNGYATFGPNAATNGGNLGIGYNSTTNEGEIVAISPNVAWRAINILASQIRFNPEGLGNKVVISNATAPGTFHLDVTGSGRFTTEIQTGNLNASGQIVGVSLSDGYIQYTLAQINRADGAVELQFAGANSVRMFGNTANPITFATAGTINGFRLPSTGNNGLTWPSLLGIKSDGVVEVGRYIDFQGTSNSGTDFTIRLDGGGAGSTTLTCYGSLFVTGDTIQVATNISRLWAGLPILSNGDGRINVNSFGSYFMDFWHTGFRWGSITVSGGNTSFNQTSDYRLKENLKPIAKITERILKLKPINYNFIGYKENTDGFLAHELAEVAPYAVTGEKDAVKEDGSISPQQVDMSKLVPLLTAALQDALKRIEVLENKINNLENKINN